MTKDRYSYRLEWLLVSSRWSYDIRYYRHGQCGFEMKSLKWNMIKNDSDIYNIWTYIITKVLLRRVHDHLTDHDDESDSDQWWCHFFIIICNRVLKRLAVVDEVDGESDRKTSWLCWYVVHILVMRIINHHIFVGDCNFITHFYVMPCGRYC